MQNKALVVIDIQNDITKNYREIVDQLNKAIDWAVQQEMFVVYICQNNITPSAKNFLPGTKGADATACVKSTCFNMTKAGYTVTVLSDCVTSYDKKKIPAMLEYYESKYCKVMLLEQLIASAE